MESHSLSSLIWLRMIRFVARSNHLSNEFLERFGLTVAQFDVLNQVRSYEPITQTDLAAKLTVSCGGISRMLSRLEKENFIRREQHWKIKYISLTDEGQAKLCDVYPGQLALQSSMFDEALDEHEKQEMQRLMQKLHRHSMKKRISDE